MQSSTDFPLDNTFPSVESRRGALVQDRPTLGSLPRARRSLGWWLPPVVDLLCSSVALIAVTLIAGVGVFPAFPVAPLLLVVLNAILGVYGASASRTGLGSEEGLAWPVIRLLLAAVFAWSASLITPLGGAAQLGLWVAFAVLDTAGRALSAPLLGRLDKVERWVLVGDNVTAERLKAYEPLRRYASIVCTVAPFEDRSNPADRVAALEIVDRYQADRVVIGTQHADDESLLDLVRAFKSIGVPVSMLPRPLDLLEAPAATPSRVGGVPLIEVEELASRDAVPYTGPDRRRNRKTKVSVVVPAMNEARNIGHVLEQLPEGLHEVILVDGNSEDGTIEAARQAYPGIRVLVQSGRGKGDAFRTGFAAVTGNLIVMLDADGSADPAEIPRFVAALEAGADFAKGSRYLPGGGSTDITGLRSLGNKVLSGSANLLHGTHFTDLCYGYNAFWARCLPFISLDVPGFEVETLINLRIAGAGMKITEVPSYELDRIHGESNLNTFRDGFRVLGTILREARRRRGIQTERPAVDAATRKEKAAATTA
ncbi:MAG TPA: glycosyltransferase [Solirubrobacterales bacterium]|nr:glycosyltransferase [Solirubrobacterales bacterium]